jgi:uncharacterized glyoxalase superfamily protein PhnB
MTEAAALDLGQVTAYASTLYEDPDAAIEWLGRTLGFELQEMVRDDDGNVVHAEVRLGEAIVMLGASGTGREPFRSLPGGPGVVYIAVENIEGLYERSRAAGADVALELTDTDYGSRDFTLRDPQGHLWAFGTYRPPADPEVTA